MFAWLYDKYMDGMSLLGGLVHVSVDSTESAGESEGESIGQFSVLDSVATKAGNRYRGVGVIVGALGIAIVFSAVAPMALEIENQRWLMTFGGLKVAMMSGMLVLVYRIGRKSGLKSQWISSRRKAERLRYERLRAMMDALHHQPDESSVSNVCEELKRVLDGESGQISYNLSKAEKYRSIERSSEILSWFGFSIAFASATWLLLSEIGWVHHRSWLLLGTAAVPALVGGIHGINGFLNISGLAEEHMKMANFLKGIRDELGKTSQNDTEAVLLIAERGYSQLADRDVQWAESTEKVRLKPA